MIFQAEQIFRFCKTILSCLPFSSFEPKVSESIVYEPPVHKALTDLKELNLPEASYPMNCDNRETDVTLAYIYHPKEMPQVICLSNLL